MLELKIAVFENTFYSDNYTYKRIAYLHTLFEVNKDGFIKFYSFLIDQYDEYAAKIPVPYPETIQYFEKIQNKLVSSKINVKDLLSTIIQDYLNKV
jgi:hypothetical protein